FGRVRLVDACGRADESVPGLADDERRPHTDDALRLAEDPLDAARVSLVACDLACALGRLDIVEPDDSPLHLRDRLLRDDDDVAVLELDAVDDVRGEVVAFVQLRDAGDGKDVEAGQCRPVTWTPACAR